MQCPSCGANVTSAFCTYCGAKAPIERVETQSYKGDTVVVNNYYYGPQAGQAQQPHPYQQQPPMNRAASGVYGPVTANVNGGAPYGAGMVSPKSKIAAILLCIFLGIFGAHRFYLGYYLRGAIYLFTFGIFGIGWIVDLVLLVLDRMRDKYGLPVVNS